MGAGGGGREGSGVGGGGGAFEPGEGRGAWEEEPVVKVLHDAHNQITAPLLEAFTNILSAITATTGPCGP